MPRPMLNKHIISWAHHYYSLQRK